MLTTSKADCPTATLPCPVAKSPKASNPKDMLPLCSPTKLPNDLLPIAILLEPVSSDDSVSTPKPTLLVPVDKIKVIEKDNRFTIILIVILAALFFVILRKNYVA